MCRFAALHLPGAHLQRLGAALLPQQPLAGRLRRLEPLLRGVQGGQQESVQGGHLVRQHRAGMGGHIFSKRALLTFLILLTVGRRCEDIFLRMQLGHN